jgi:AcrR family transcriptional regulator
VSRMTLYRRWPDTRALLADLMTREWQRVALDAEPAAGAHGLDRLVEGVVALVAALRDDRLFRRVVEVDPEELLPYLLRRRGRSQDLLAAMLAERIEEGQRDGVVRSGDPELLARSVLLAGHGFLLSVHTMTGRTAHASHDLAAYDEQLGLLVRGYLAP